VNKGFRPELSLFRKTDPSQNDRLNVARIEYLSNGSLRQRQNHPHPPSTFSTVEMNYTTGDVLLYKK